MSKLQNTQLNQIRNVNVTFLCYVIIVCDGSYILRYFLEVL